VKLNLGSYKEKFPGFLNVDIDPSVNPDICCDIEKGIPLDDNTVSQIKAIMILEHIDNIIFVMNELWRILKPGGTIDIVVPHEASAMALADPTHKRVFNEESFGYFCSKWHGGINGKSNHYRIAPTYGITCNYEMVSQKFSTDRRKGQLKVTLKAIK
jgi:ubiquinone/menaquinone biosynthesis C-methylase UbiE